AEPPCPDSGGGSRRARRPRRRHQMAPRRQGGGRERPLARCVRRESEACGSRGRREGRPAPAHDAAAPAHLTFPRPGAKPAPSQSSSVRISDPQVMVQSALLNVMVRAAQKAARGLKRDFGEVERLQVSLKGPGNFVCAADHRAEEVLRSELAKARPGYGFLGEECGRIDGPDKTHCWIVDPLDGTTNFLHGIPQFAISIALVRDGVIAAGLVYNPASDELYAAERGKGAF